MAKKLLFVKWRDAEQHGETWTSEADALEFADGDCLAVSIGWEIKRNKVYLTLGSDWDETNGNWGCTRKIPRKMIQSEVQVFLPETCDEEGPA